MRRCLLLPALALLLALTARAETGLGRHKKVYAVPVSGAVTIDGKLDEWDLSGQIEMFVMSETKEMQSAKFALMYDSEAVYLGAELRDPSPMMNRQDPAVNGNRGWDADSCQFRLVIDPTVGYPANFSKLVSGIKVDPGSGRLAHLTLWYYTDAKQPVLQIHHGMDYTLPRPEWAPHGVVPAGLFSAVYLPAADGRGYTFEYRIPWSTLGATKPFAGGDLAAGTVQFNWSRADGLKTAGGSAWCYDVMAGPGFPYQATACWGKIIFSATGKLPRELVEEGVPPELPLPLTFCYDVPRDSEVSIALFDAEGTVVRTLVAQSKRRAGENLERWDGFGENGKPLPAGDYIWKGLHHEPVTTKYVMSVHNSGQPGYPTDDNKGGWGGDHDSPTSVCAAGDAMLLSWRGCELGWGIIKTDLKGRKQWGSKHGAMHLASAGDRFFAAGGHGFQPSPAVMVFDLADGRPLNFGNGKPELAAPTAEELKDGEVTGLAVLGRFVIVAYGPRNLVAAYHVQSGNLLFTVPVTAPGALAAATDGSLVAVAGGKGLVRLTLDAEKLKLFDFEAADAKVVDGATLCRVTPIVADQLTDPRGLAVGADGAIYVAQGGDRQQVAVFGADGKALRTLGKAGGRPRLGRYEADGMLEPGGIAMAKDGRLWVAETLDFPKRHSVWDPATGALSQEFFGGSAYFGWLWMDPQRPDEVYCHNVRWKVDLDKGTWTPHSTIWRATAPNVVKESNPNGYAGHLRVITAKNGRQYAFGQADYGPVLYRAEGDLFKPFAAVIRLVRPGGYSPTGASYALLFDDPKTYPDGMYWWQDANHDQTIQTTEVTRPDQNASSAFNWLDADLNAWCDGGFVLRPTSIDEQGQPHYDYAQRQAIPFKGQNGNATSLYTDDEGYIYTLSGSTFARFTPDWKPLWTYRDLVPWAKALGLPMVTPGKLHGLTMPLTVAGDFTGAVTYFNPYHIFTRDGIYVAMLTRDGRAGGLGPDVIATESIQGQLVKPAGMNRYFLLAGAQDGRITEVFGLDTVERLPGGTYTHTPEMVAAAIAARQAYDQVLAKSRRLEIVRGKAGLKDAPPITKRVDERRSFEVRAAYDATHLYLAYDVTSPAKLVSAAPDQKLLFKGGNCLDLQLATNPAAAADRKTPAPGDLRLLVTRQGKATVAMLYQPKVAGFTGEPTVFRSPTGTESFDRIVALADVKLEYKETPAGFTATVSVPLATLGLKLQPGQDMRLDLGYLFGNAEGTQTAARAYWCNNGFSANVTYDIPNESRLEPALWGTATVE
jgi:sugar lactone lactonase YvrE